MAAQKHKTNFHKMSQRLSNGTSCLFWFFSCLLVCFAESGPNAASHKEVMKLRKDNQILTEENNFLKLKVDILLDMVLP